MPTKKATTADRTASAAARTATATKAPDATSAVVATAPAPSPRVGVRKTYKLFIGGAFPRSESGRSYPVASADGEFLANA
ncbi:MAG TPA: hypothetical protein VF163_08595, partial [Micromonosporaceae bacterium]